MVQEILKIAAFQFHLEWEDVGANLSRIDQMLQQHGNDADVVFLPEMFTTGFTMNAPRVAETMNGETIAWLQERCSRYQLAICGSLVILENGRYFNRMVFVEPSGKISFYNKRHLFTMSGEEKNYASEGPRLIVSYKGWRICPLVCYDLRFPVWSRNLGEYDLLVYSANWPEPRALVWNTLLKARAIENQSYVIGVNRVGRDGNKIGYAGQSQIIDAKGNILSIAQDFRQDVITADLSMSELSAFRKKFPVLDDADHFTIS